MCYFITTKNLLSLVSITSLIMFIVTRKNWNLGSKINNCGSWRQAWTSCNWCFRSWLGMPVLTWVVWTALLMAEDFILAIMYPFCDSGNWKWGCMLFPWHDSSNAELGVWRGKDTFWLWIWFSSKQQVTK